MYFLRQLSIAWKKKSLAANQDSFPSTALSVILFFLPCYEFYNLNVEFCLFFRALLLRQKCKQNCPTINMMHFFG